MRSTRESKRYNNNNMEQVMTQLKQTPRKPTPQFYAEFLIEAIQARDINQLERLVQSIVQQTPDAVKGSWMKRYALINAGYGNLGITALMVASKSYAVHYNDIPTRNIFEAMVDILLDSGADPYVSADASLGQAMNAITVCNGRLTPALRAYVKQAQEKHGPATRPEECPKDHNLENKMRGMDAMSLHAPSRSFSSLGCY